MRALKQKEIHLELPPKLTYKLANQTKKSSEKKVTAKGKEINVKIVTMDVNKLEYLQEFLTQTGHIKEHLKSEKID